MSNVIQYKELLAFFIGGYGVFFITPQWNSTIRDIQAKGDGREKMQPSNEKKCHENRYCSPRSGSNKL